MMLWWIIPLVVIVAGIALAVSCGRMFDDWALFVGVVVAFLAGCWLLIAVGMVTTSTRSCRAIADATSEVKSAEWAVWTGCIVELQDGTRLPLDRWINVTGVQP